MCSLPRLLAFILPCAVAISAYGQAQRPQFRPAVLSTGPNSLVNRINAEELLKKGQKDGAVQFAATVGPDGTSGEVWTYHAMPGSEELERAVLKALEESRFTPPIYNHQPVTAVLYGTVIFEEEKKPHVRVLLNQDPERIKDLADFIGPQPVVGGDSMFDGLHVPQTLPVAIEGVVDVEIQVTEKGHLNRLDVLLEDPPLLGFATAVLADFEGTKFIPAFRDGDVEASKSIMSICYKPVGIAPEPFELAPPPEPES